MVDYKNNKYKCFPGLFNNDYKCSLLNDDVGINVYNTKEECDTNCLKQTINISRNNDISKNILSFLPFNYEDKKNGDRLSDYLHGSLTRFKFLEKLMSEFDDKIKSYRMYDIHEESMKINKLKGIICTEINKYDNIPVYANSIFEWMMSIKYYSILSLFDECIFGKGYLKFFNALSPKNQKLFINVIFSKLSKFDMRNSKSNIFQYVWPHILELKNNELSVMIIHILLNKFDVIYYGTINEIVKDGLHQYLTSSQIEQLLNIDNFNYVINIYTSPSTVRRGQITVIPTSGENISNPTDYIFIYNYIFADDYLMAFLLKDYFKYLISLMNLGYLYYHENEIQSQSEIIIENIKNKLKIFKKWLDEPKLNEKIMVDFDIPLSINTLYDFYYNYLISLS